ncbi:MAG: L-rhamnose mutarotase [Terriglobia bacterium]
MKSATVTRYGQILRVKRDSVGEYVRYHQAVWPEVLATIRECNIRNYSIFLKDGTLFAYFEYAGEDFAADMARMAADPKTKEWWAIMMPMQEPVATRADGEWWANMKEVFHTE